MNKITENIPLADYSSYRIGGSARFFAEFGDKVTKEILAEWKEISKDLSESGKRIFILGGGTNILIDDKGFDGLVIHNKIKDIKILRDKDIKSIKTKSPSISISQYPNIYLAVGSGVLVGDLLDYCIENSLSGLEWAGGLPGTVGGAVRGNAGAFGGEIKDNIAFVTSFDLKTSEIKKRTKDECKFGYRESIFKSEKVNEVILGVEFGLTLGNKEEIESQINEKIEYRKQKHPNISDSPNIGSTFKNIPVVNLQESVVEEFKDKIKTDPFPVLPAGKLIAGSGMTGERVGDIEVSKKHPNFLVNTGHGKSSDVLSLISKIKSAVKKKYGVELEEEITIIS